MNSSKRYEILGVILSLCGVLLLGFVYFPNLNPAQYRLSPGPQLVGWQRYGLGTLVALLLLSAGWYFNSKAVRMNREMSDER